MFRGETTVLAHIPQLKSAQQPDLVPGKSTITAATVPQHKTVKTGLIFGENIYRDRHGVQS